MTRRRRAAGLLVLAVLSAIVAATLASSYGESLAGRFGGYRPVLVALADLPAGRSLRPRALGGLVGVRRVPARFVPPGALAAADDAAGRVPAALIPAGAYVLDAQLKLPGATHSPATGIRGGLQPVQIAVSGAGALGRSARTGAHVDVLVTTEPAVSGERGRTYVAAEGVQLLDLVRSPDAGTGSGGGAPADWIATLALNRSQAIDLIEAENFARQVSLIPSVSQP
jgi:Flp pilus assembly protein CpaB